MATAAQIRERAATRLGILGEGETLPSYETADMDASYVEIYAQLGALSLAVWDYDEDVPDEYTTHVITLVAYNRANDYSISNDRYARIAADNQAAIPAIRELQTNDAIQQDQPDYF
jgi:hypothetical protein